MNFDNDPQGIYAEVLRVVRHWIAQGVKIFRVDNPHTKPPNFWAWLIGRLRTTIPTCCFWPRRSPGPPGCTGLPSWVHSVLHVLHLAHREAGAHRVRRGARRARRLCTAESVREYAGHPAREPAARRPGHVRDPGGAGATMSSSWGVYSGYELFEHVAAREGSEEYLDSEKYELRPRVSRRARTVNRWSRSPGSTRFVAFTPHFNNFATSISTTSTMTRCWPTASSTRSPVTRCCWWYLVVVITEMLAVWRDVEGPLESRVGEQQPRCAHAQSR